MLERRDLSWSINGTSWGIQKKTSDVFRYQIQRATKTLPFREALHTALQDVRTQFGMPAVMYSGGADSEMLLREFHSLNLRPEVHFVKFDNGANEVDYRIALELVAKLGFKMYVHEHSIESFLNSGQHRDLASKFHTSDLSLITVYKYAQHLGKAIMLGPELLLQKHQLDDHSERWSLILGEHTFSEQKFRMETRQPLIGELHYWNSDLLLSMLKLPTVRMLVDDQLAGRVSLAYLKNFMLEEALGYKFLADKKRHGYESVYHTFRRAVNEMKRGMAFLQPEIKMDYHTVLQQLEL